MPRPNAPEAYQKVVAERLDEMDETFLAALGAYAQAATQQDPILAGRQGADPLSVADICSNMTCIAKIM